MADEKQGGNGEDDSYVLEDSGESIEDIEHEMEVAAQEADSTLSRRAKAPASGPLVEENAQLKDRYLRTLADFENFRKRSEREKSDFFKYALAGLLRELLPV